MSMPQLERVRWIMFPGVRVPVFQAKGLTDRVHVRNFHKWCRQQLVTFGQEIPGQGVGMFDAMVDNVIRGVERKQIPSGQYQAVLLDEGHDFQPEWFKLVTQMVDPETNSLLVLYDSAQNIYEKSKNKKKINGAAKQFSFKSVGIQASGRTTILRINYRNTKQILQTANLVAAEFLKPDAQDEDGTPLIQAVSCGRDGQAPLIIRLPSPREEATKIAELLASAHQEGHAWGDMAILCRRYSVMEDCAQALKAKGFGDSSTWILLNAVFTMLATGQGERRSPRVNQPSAYWYARGQHRASSTSSLREASAKDGAGQWKQRRSTAPATRARPAIEPGPKQSARRFERRPRPESRCSHSTLSRLRIGAARRRKSATSRGC